MQQSHSQLREDIRNLNIFLQKFGKKLDLRIKNGQKKINENTSLFSDNLSFSNTNSIASNSGNSSSIVNPGGSKPDILNGDNSSSIVNPCDSKPDILNGDNSSSIVNPGDSKPDILNGDNSSSIVNPGDSKPDILNGDNSSSIVNPGDSKPDVLNGDNSSSIVNPSDSKPDILNGDNSSSIVNPGVSKLDTSNGDNSSSILNLDTNPIQFNIKLSTKKQTLTPKEFPYTVNLGNYFINAVDSKGNDISLDKIKITVDGKKLNHPFIEQIEEPKSINICYYFEDPFLNASNENPIKCCQYLTLIFNKKDNQFNIKKYSPPLIEPIAFSYEFRLNNVGKLIDQINKLWADNEEYDMCIASSIRVIFDLTTFHYEILRAENPSSQNHPLPKGLEKQVAFIIREITSDNHTYSKLSQLLSPRHSIVKNIFEEPENFSKKVSQSNLGSHTGLTHSSLEVFAEIARFAGQYAQLVDAYCRTKKWIV